MGRSDDDKSFSCVCQVAPRVNVRKTLDKLLGAAEKFNSCVRAQNSRLQQTGVAKVAAAWRQGSNN